MFERKIFLYSRNSYELLPFEIGTHKYFGKEIDVAPIKSANSGLCYKLKFADPLPFYPASLNLIISSSTQGLDKLEKVHILVASNNTWQGIVGNRWPYSKKAPLSIKGTFSTEVISSFIVDLEENIWKSRNGSSDFDRCLNDRYLKDCASIFDPRPNTNQ